MIKIKKFNENKTENNIDLEKVKSDINKLNDIYNDLFSYVDILLEESGYCAFKKTNGEYIIPHTIEAGENDYGFDIILDDEYYMETLIIDNIIEIKELSDLNEDEFIKLYKKYNPLNKRYEKIFDKVKKYKYITQADKYNL